MVNLSSSEHVCACLQALFGEIEAAGGATEAVLAARLVLQLTVVEPDAVVVINGRQAPVQVSFCTDGVKPDLEVTLAAATLHRILLHELSLRKAIGSGQVKVRGPIWRVGPLEPILRQGRLIYPRLAAEDSACGGATG
jgi:hypothetical protein